MARTRKSIQALNLYKYDVLIEDKATRSDYFKVTQFDGNFYGGRNAFLVAGTGVLRPNSKILVEILNKDGTTVYSAPITSFIEGNSRLVQIEVYNDTPIGAGKLVLLGCADTYLDGTPVPANWEGKYNVRWITDVVISPQIENKTPIRFEATPSMVATEKFYYAPSSSLGTQQLRVPIDVELTPKYYNVFPNGYLAKIRGIGEYQSEYLGGFITGTIAFGNDTVSETASVNIPITKIYNSDLAESQGTLIYTNNNILVLDAFLSSSGIYTASFQQFGSVVASSSINIEYSKLISFNTGSNISFSKIRLVDLKTISGEIHRIRLSYKPSTEPGEFVLLGDIDTSVSELLAVDSGSRIVETGTFADIQFADYWYSETMSLQRNVSNPTIPNYYISSSLSSSYLPTVQSSTTLLNSITATPQIVNNNYVDNVSYFIGTKNTNTLQLFPRVEYTIAFDAVVSNTSQSITLDQSDYSLEVYLVNEGGLTGKLITPDARGQLLGTLTPTSTFQRQNFENTEFNFIPKTIATGNFGLRFVSYGGFWNIANVSVKPAQEPFFSPDEIDILIPNVNYADSVITFRAQYLDVNNNSIGLSTFSPPTYFTGSKSTTSAISSITFVGNSRIIADVNGNIDIISGDDDSYAEIGSFNEENYMYVDNSGSHIQTNYTTGPVHTWDFTMDGTLLAAGLIIGTASNALTTSNLLGGTANYIPLWTSSTIQSSSAISQNAGNIGINVPPASIQARLHVSGGNIQLDNNAGLRILNNVGTAESVTSLSTANNLSLASPTIGGSIIYAVRNSAGAHQFFIGGIEYARIASSGNVGIGTTNPGATLHIQGNVSASTYTSSISNGVGFFGTASRAVTASYALAALGGGLSGGTTNYIPLWTSATAQSSSNLYQSSSNIGIGITNPSASLHISGTMAVQSIFEKVTVTASAAPATLNYNILDQAILFHSASSTTNWTLNFRGNASTTLNSVMYTGQSLTTTLMVLNTTTAYSASAYQIDGTSIIPRWQGGTSGSANTNSLDAHTFTIIKTSATPTYVLLGSITKYT